MKKFLATALAATTLTLASASAFAQAITPPGGTAYPAPLVKQPPIDTPERVLFVGNSLMYYNGGLQTHTHRMAAAADVKYSKLKDGFKSLHITGANLEQYPIDYMVTPGNLGIKQPFQLALLAGSAKDPGTPEGVANYKRKVREWDVAMKKQGGKIALIWLQTFVDKGWDQDTFRRNGEMVVATANEVGALVIPVGPAFEESYRRRPDLKLQMGYDGYHPTLAGQYLSAAVVFASLYGRSPVGNSYDYFGALDKPTAAFLQQVAADTVKKFYAQ